MEARAETANVDLINVIEAITSSTQEIEEYLAKQSNNPALSASIVNKYKAAYAKRNGVFQTLQQNPDVALRIVRDKQLLNKLGFGDSLALLASECPAVMYELMKNNIQALKDIPVVTFDKLVSSFSLNISMRYQPRTIHGIEVKESHSATRAEREKMCVTIAKSEECRASLGATAEMLLLSALKRSEYFRTSAGQLPIELFRQIMDAHVIRTELSTYNCESNYWLALLGFADHDFDDTFKQLLAIVLVQRETEEFSADERKAMAELLVIEQNLSDMVSEKFKADKTKLRFALGQRYKHVTRILLEKVATRGTAAELEDDDIATLPVLVCSPYETCSLVSCGII